MNNILFQLVAFCTLIILYIGHPFIAPVLSGFVLASGLRPLLKQFPFRKIKSERLKSLTVLLAFLTAFGALTTYVLIASARGLARNVEFKNGEAIQMLEKPEGQVEKSAENSSDNPSENASDKPPENVDEAPAVGFDVNAQIAFEEKVEPEDSSFVQKVKNLVQKIPGMNPEEITRTWVEILSKARGLAFAFLSKILTAGPALFIEWGIFLIAFIMFFWNYETLILGILRFQSKFKEIHTCVTFFENATQATLIGTLIVGLAQGSIISLGTGIAGYDSFVLLGLCAFFASFVPFFGTALVWVTILIYSLINGDTQAAIIVGVTGALSSVADNLILPTFVGSKNKVHPLLLFVVVIGMIDLVGIWGLFLGPVLSIFGTRVIELWFEKTFPV